MDILTINLDRRVKAGGVRSPPIPHCSKQKSNESLRLNLFPPLILRISMVQKMLSTVPGTQQTGTECCCG